MDEYKLKLEQALLAKHNVKFEIEEKKRKEEERLRLIEEEKKRIEEEEVQKATKGKGKKK